MAEEPEVKDALERAAQIFVGDKAETPWQEFWHDFRCILYANLVRKPTRWWQRRTRGWDDSELWDLDGTFQEWIVPRLIEFKKQSNGQVSHGDELNKAIDEMIDGFDVQGKPWPKDIKDYVLEHRARADKLERAYKLFGEFAQGLWW